MMTIAEWSRELGVSRQAASQAAKRLSLPLQDGKLDADLATPAYRAHTRQRVRTGGRVAPGAQPQPAPDRVTYEEARRREAVARAQLAENEVQVQAGTLAPISLLADALAVAAGVIADRLDALPGQLRVRLPDLSAEARDVIANVCAEARNQWIRDTSALVARRLELAEDDEPDHAAASGAEGGPRR